MEKEQEMSDSQFWKAEIKKYWKELILCIAAIVVLLVIAVNVVFWHIQTSPIGNYGTATFNEWSLEWIVIFSIVLILWELLFVGVPGGLIFGLGGYLWWQRITDEEKAKFKQNEAKNHKARNAGGGGGFFIFIAYCIYMAINGTYSAAFGSQSFSYWIYSYLLMMGWLLILFGIPAAVGGLLYLRYWLNKP